VPRPSPDSNTRGVRRSWEDRPSVSLKREKQETGGGPISCAIGGICAGKLLVVMLVVHVFAMREPVRMLLHFVTDVRMIVHILVKARM
jgi:hypothetical protein